MDNITIKTLAKKLNISTSTISRAFSGSTDINKGTRERILAFAKEHNQKIWGAALIYRAGDLSDVADCDDRKAWQQVVPQLPARRA